MAEQKPSSEIERYRELLARDPKSRAFAHLADAYRRQGRYAEAIAVCERGLARYPTYLGARMVLARALGEQGEAARAEAEFRLILGLAPDNIAAHRELGDLLRGGDRPAEALEVYEGLLQLIPFDREVRELVENLQASVPPGATAAPGPAAPAAAKGLVGVGPQAREAAIPYFELSEAAAEDMPLALGPPVGEPVWEVPTEHTTPLEDIQAAASKPSAAIPPSGRPAPTAEAGRVPPGPPPVERLVEASPPGGVLATETLADLYVQQGFLEEARAIYQELMRVDPARPDLRAKLASLGAPPASAAAAPQASAQAVETPPPAEAVGVPAKEDRAVEALEAWLAVARDLRAERGRR